MRGDSGAEVLFRPGSPLPEIRPYEKRDSEKKDFFSISLFFPSFASLFRSKRQNDIFDRKNGPFVKKKGTKQ